MSALLGNGTLANLNTAYYSGGGGGPVGPTISTVVLAASTLAVSSITGSGPGQSLSFPNGIEMPLGGSLTFPVGAGAGGVFDIEFTANNGQIGGVSTINGAPYTPAPLNSKITVGGAGGNYYVSPNSSLPLVSFSTTNLHLYRVAAPFLQVGNQPVGVPAAGSWTDLSVDTAVKITYLDTFDMASVSTIANDLQKAPVYTFIATGANHTITATAAPGNSLSTAITLGGPLWLEDLGLITGFPNAN